MLLQKSRSVWAPLVAAQLLVACQDRAPDPTMGEALPLVTDVRVVPEAIELAVGQSMAVGAVLSDRAGNSVPGRSVGSGVITEASDAPAELMSDASGRSGRLVVWRSTDPEVARIQEDGRVHAVGPGTAEIVGLSANVEGRARVRVVSGPDADFRVAPISAQLAVGDRIELGSAGSVPDAAIAWTSNDPDKVRITEGGGADAIAPGTATLVARLDQDSTRVTLNVVPAEIVRGLDFPGNGGVRRTMRFEFSSPLDAFPATYIWHAYPRQQQSYYTAFFWGNLGPFFPSNTYYGFHPYPDWATTHDHFWEIAAPPGGDYVSASHVVYDRWFVQVAICRIVDGKTRVDLYFDWPDTTKVIRYSGDRYPDPPLPGLVVGDAPWNPGKEVWNGVLRGFQFYDAALSLAEVERELAEPGAVRTPWYLQRDPRPDDILDRSGLGNHPEWVGGERPDAWTGRRQPGGPITTLVPPP